MIAVTAQTAHRNGKRVAFLAVLLTVAVTPAVLAAPPLNALPPPFFCFDADSPSVAAGWMGPADILALGTVHPQAVVQGCQLGLPDPTDRLASLSSPHSTWTSSTPFVILFSVDRATVGLANPDPALIAAGVPYNVKDQAARGQAAGDQYISTGQFTLSGGMQGAPSDGHNGTLGRNHFDEGGTDFQAYPQSSASAPPSAAPQDNVICTAYLAAEGSPVQHVYFTLTSNSRSLRELSGPYAHSGANVFYNACPQSGGITVVFAPCSALNLQQTDAIDALVVFDMDMDGVYDSGDSILFSLAPGSPSLTTIAGASSVAAAADVFLARPGCANSVFAHAQDFGLGAPSDNIDALELYSCAGDSFSLATHGIRALRGDLNCDDLLDSFDIDPFVLALIDQAAYHAAYPGCDVMRADCNYDGAVNSLDIRSFLTILAGQP